MNSDCLFIESQVGSMVFGIEERVSARPTVRQAILVTTKLAYRVLNVLNDLLIALVMCIDHYIGNGEVKELSA